MGERVRSAKRGAHGPAPARKNRLWDRGAARKGALVVRCACTGALLSSKDATQEQLAGYVGLRLHQLVSAAQARGIDVNTSRGRRWLARAARGKHEEWIQRVTRRSELTSNR